MRCSIAIWNTNPDALTRLGRDPSIWSLMRFTSAHSPDCPGVERGHSGADSRCRAVELVIRRHEAIAIRCFDHVTIIIHLVRAGRRLMGEHYVRHVEIGTD